MQEIYISHHDDNEQEAQCLAEDLVTLGHDVVFDRSRSGGQAAWDDTLAEIRRCEMFVFALTSEGLQSRVNQLELAYAFDLDKPILPVLVGDGVNTRKLPAALKSHPFVDYRVDIRRTGLQLAKRLAALPPAGPLPDPLPSPPPAPLWHLRDLERDIDPDTPLDYERQCVVLIKLQRALRNDEAHIAPASGLTAVTPCRREEPIPSRQLGL